MIKIQHKLKSGIVPVEIESKIVPSSRICVDPKWTREMCETCGAFGQNGGCPPHSPAFERIARKNILLICARVQTASYPTTVLNSHLGIKMLFAETWLKSLMDRLGKNLNAAIPKSKFLSSGCCRACHGVKCAVKLGQKCRKPRDRTFSLESTGVVVFETIPDIFGFELEWWTHESTPEFTSKVIAVTSDVIPVDHEPFLLSHLGSY